MENIEEKFLLVVTGATGGLGRCVVRFFVERALADSRLHPVFCCRNQAKGAELQQEVERMGLKPGGFHLMRADLSNSRGVAVLAEKIQNLGRPILWLVNNAASMFPDYGHNEDGVEMSMAVNFCAPAQLAELLIPQLLPDSSLVNILSVSRSFFPLSPDFLCGSPRRYFRLKSYSCSKLALSIFTADLARRHPHLHINGVDPGVMNTSMLKMDKWFDPLTDILFRPFTRKPEQSLPAVVAACLNVDKVSGHIFTVKRHFPIEDQIARHPLCTAVRAAVWGKCDSRLV